MRKRLALLLALSSIVTTFGQEKDDPILTVDENAAWITEFKMGDLENRLEKLRARLSNDQRTYYVATRNAHGPDRVEEGFEEQTFIRPLYIFRAESGEVFVLAANPSGELVEKLTRVLIPSKVSSVSFKDGNEMSALYGSRARFGVIEINLFQQETLDGLKKSSGS